MNVTSILAELKLERTRIDQAIAAITSLNSTNHQSSRGAISTNAPKRRRGRMSVVARRKLSLLLKQRWAAGKMGRKLSAQTSEPKRRISTAGRKRIAEATKRRWAEWRRKQVKAKAKAA